MADLEYLETLIGITPTGTIYVMSNDGSHPPVRYDPEERRLDER